MLFTIAFKRSGISKEKQGKPAFFSLKNKADDFSLIDFFFTSQTLFVI